ncbi:MAG TPA: hypothetical protein VGA62_07355 [Acidimicrobiia bacterium]
MSIDEVRMRLRRKLEELVGVSGADILMDRPPGGWGDLVTNHTLDLRFDAFEARMDAKMDRRFAEVDRKFADLELRLERSLRGQTMTMIGTMLGLSGAIVAAVRL